MKIIGLYALMILTYGLYGWHTYGNNKIKEDSPMVYIGLFLFFALAGNLVWAILSKDPNLTGKEIFIRGRVFDIFVALIAVVSPALFSSSKINSNYYIGVFFLLVSAYFTTVAGMSD